MSQTSAHANELAEDGCQKAVWPTPARSESPINYADRVGAWYVSRRSARSRKEHGLYLTPVAVAAHMAQQIEVEGSRLRVLDPAAGAGVLCCAVVEALASRAVEPLHVVHVEIVAYEVDGGLLAPLRAVFAHLCAWARPRGVTVTAQAAGRDFVAAHAAELRANGELFARESSAAFDVVIANPPYFKIAKTDPRALALPEVVHGQPNIYALFMAVSAALLRQGGQFVFITPRSFASGPYFRKFRDVFFGMIQPTEVHVFRSRREAFRRDDVLQENIVLFGVRRDSWPQAAQAAQLLVTSSDGQDDLGQRDECAVWMGMAIDLRSVDKVLRLPTCGDDQAVMKMVDTWPNSLSALGMNISTGPVVPFRAAKHITSAGSVPDVHVPLLWMNHVRPLRTTWPLARHKPEYIERDNAGALLVPSRNQQPARALRYLRECACGRAELRHGKLETRSARLSARQGEAARGALKESSHGSCDYSEWIASSTLARQAQCRPKSRRRAVCAPFRAGFASALLG